jgi:hypothetical protein
MKKAFKKGKSSSEEKTDSDGLSSDTKEVNEETDTELNNEDAENSVIKTFNK